MADEEQLPDLEKLSQDLGYDFTEDEPDLSQHKKAAYDRSMDDEVMPAFEEIADELASIRPHRKSNKTAEQAPDTEYVMEDFTKADSDPLEDFDFAKYSVPDDSEDSEEEESVDFDDAEFQEWLAQQEEAEKDETEPVPDQDSDSDYSEDEDYDGDDTDDEDYDGLDDDLIAALAETEASPEEKFQPEPKSSIPNIPVVPRNYTPLDDDDEDDEDEEESYSVGSGGGNNLYYPDTFEKDQADEEEVERVAPAETESENPFEGLNKKRKVKSGEGALSGFKEKFAAFLAQAKAELHGEESAEPGKELAVVEKPDKREVGEKKEPKEPGIFSKILSPFKKFYEGVAGFFFGVIVWILGVLGKLPLVGKYFLKLRDNTKVINVISNLIPVVLLVLFLAWLNARAVESETSTDLPDLGSVSFTDFKYEDGVAEGRLVNTGEVIAQVQPVFSVYAMDPGLNPKSWVIPEKQFECVGNMLRVDIDEESVVTAKCEETPDGFQVRVSGVVQ